MRIFTSILEAVREVERDLWEMGIDVHPQTMQDKDVADDLDYATKEVRGYGFKIVEPTATIPNAFEVVDYIFKGREDPQAIMRYIQQEFTDRVSNLPSNPGRAADARLGIWDEFMHDGKFAYTYSERIVPQLGRIMAELEANRETRQAIINIHSNIRAVNTIGQDGTHPVSQSADMMNMGGVSRVPCSMYYQMMIRENALDLIYTMRSCDFLVHFPVDILLAIKLQNYIAQSLQLNTGTFTYFTGSLHAYRKDMKARGIF